MENFWNIFKQICEIPHCSGDTKQLANFIEKWANKYGYKVQTDKASNIICYHENATMTLQSHYDMVCMGCAPKIELVQKDNILSAYNSSLGADNGIGVALMLLAMQKQLPIDCLFTSDEEIGLIGANALEHTIKTKSILNLDSEDSGAIYIGCAGSTNIIATLPLKYRSIKDTNYYECLVKDLPGGHSGIDIDKDIPNANIELAKLLQKYDIKLVTIDGGQKHNAISNAAKATFIAQDSSNFPTTFKENKDITKGYYYEDSNNILQAISNMPHGVKKYNKIYNIPHSSVNFAFVNIKNHELSVELSLRFLDKGVQLKKEVKKYLNSYGFIISQEIDKYSSWKPKKSQFSERLAKIVKEVHGFADFKVVPAGLECAVLQNKAPKAFLASIGPDIKHPHTTRETVDKNSVKEFKEIVFKFINSEQEFNKKLKE